MNLIEEVKESFEHYRDRESADRPPVTILRPESGDVLGPGFNAMRECYMDRLMTVVRRGYYHFAGSTQHEDEDGHVVVDLTCTVMLPQLTPVLMQSFTDGVLIAQRSDYQVKMSWHFNRVDELFEDSDFRESSTAMATGFAEDPEVAEFFTGFIQTCIRGMAHVTGFAHSKTNLDKVWDLWMMTGASVASTSYLAGIQLGNAWRERDVLDGIEIASEDPHGPD